MLSFLRRLVGYDPDFLRVVKGFFIVFFMVGAAMVLVILAFLLVNFFSA